MEPSEVFDYQCALLADLESVISPLFQFSVNTFEHRKFLLDGRSFSISTNKEWLHFHNEHLIGLPAPSYEQEIKKTIQLGEYNSFREGEPDPNDALCVSLCNFGIWNTLCIYEKNHTGVNGFYFSTNKENTNFNIFFLSNLSLLKKYVQFFNDKFSTIASDEIINKLAFPTIPKECFAPTVSNHTQNSLKNSFERGKIKIMHHDKEISLSKREYEVLQYLAQGRSSKEAAKILNLSPRTIESYIENTKNKLGVFYKSELISSFYDSLEDRALVSRKKVK